MERVYSVKINGRTLEGRNLRKLLARAVSVKRNPDRGSILKSPCGKVSTESVTGAYIHPGNAVAH